MKTKKDVMTKQQGKKVTQFDRLPEPQFDSKRAEVETTYSVFKFNLSANESKGVKYVNKVQALVERFNGEFYLAYAHKNLYRFEIGGEFDKASDAAKFGSAYEKLPAVRPCACNR